MMDYAAVIALACLWASTLVLAYGQGWVKGWQKSQEDHKWGRWFLRNTTNRSTRI